MSKANKSPAQFHLTSAKDFLYCLENTLARYKKSRVKRVEDLFFLVMGLAHLREWIAPGYKHEQTAVTPAQHFYNDIYKIQDFKTVLALCNGIKHLDIEHSDNRPAPNTSYSADLPFNEWPAPIDEVLKWDDGPPTDFYVDKEKIEEMLQRLVDFYKEKWFS